MAEEAQSQSRTGSGEVPSRRTVRRDSRRIAAERSPEERRRRRIALIIIGVMLLVITGIVVAGYVIIFVLPPQQLVVRVDDVVYTRGDMVKLLRLRQTLYGAGSDPADSHQ